MLQSTLSCCAVRKVCFLATYQALWTPSSLSSTDGTYPPRQVRTHDTHVANASIISADVSASLPYPVLSYPVLTCPTLSCPILSHHITDSHSSSQLSLRIQTLSDQHTHTHTHTHIHTYTHSSYLMHLLTIESQYFSSFNSLIPSTNNTMRRWHVWS